MFDHVGIAVADLDAALALHGRAYGMPVVHRETLVEHGVEAVLLDVGGGHVELLRPLSAETPVGKFLAARGPGLHHVAYSVADIEAALAELRRTSRVGIRGAQVAFVHPSTAAGVLTELVQPARFDA